MEPTDIIHFKERVLCQQSKKSWQANLSLLNGCCSQFWAIQLFYKYLQIAEIYLLNYCKWPCVCLETLSEFFFFSKGDVSWSVGREVLVLALVECDVVLVDCVTTWHWRAHSSPLNESIRLSLTSHPDSWEATHTHTGLPSVLNVTA